MQNMYEKFVGAMQPEENEEEKKGQDGSPNNIYLEPQELSNEQSTYLFLKENLGMRIFTELKNILEEKTEVKKSLEEKISEMQNIFKDKNVNQLEEFNFTFEIDSKNSINLLQSSYVIGQKGDYVLIKKFQPDEFYEKLLEIISSNNPRARAPSEAQTIHQYDREEQEWGRGNTKDSDKGKEKNSGVKQEKEKEQDKEEKEESEKENSPRQGKKEQEFDNRDSHNSSNNFQKLYDLVTQNLASYAKEKSKTKDKVKQVTGDFKFFTTKKFDLSLSDFVSGGVIPKRKKSIGLLGDLANNLLQNVIKDSQAQPYSDDQKCNILFGALLNLIEPMQKKRNSITSIKMWKEKCKPSEFLEMANEIKKEFYKYLNNKNVEAYEVECKEAYKKFADQKIDSEFTLIENNETPRVK